MQAAEHGATFPMAKKLRKTMTHTQLHDFSVGSEAGKPEHVGKPPMLSGSSHSIIGSNTSALRQSGKNEFDATREAIKVSVKSHPNRHKNLKNFIHPRKDGKPHGS